ncbi:MAG: hypothetical protein ACRD59_12385 [Candidatus Acidiferrales bacterium]
MPLPGRPMLPAQILLHAVLAFAFLVIVMVIAIAAPIRAQQSPPTQPAQPSSSAFHEDLLAEISPGAEVKQTTVSDHHLAWVEKQGDKRTVRLDGKQQGGAFDEIKFLEFSRDESHFAFFGKRSSEWIFVLDGEEHPTGYTRTTSISFQPQGKSIAYCACRDKKCHLVVDGAETGAEYDDISYARYSPDGKRLAFTARRSKKWVAVVDGKELAPEFDDIWFSSLGFSRGSGRFFVSGRIKNNWLHAVDGASGPGFEVISYIAFSRDGSHYAYAGANAKAGFKKQKILGAMILDGQSVGNYEGKGMIGEWSALGGSREIMVGGVRDIDADFHGVSTPEFNPEGKLVYAARRDKGDVAVFVGPDTGPGFDEILSPVIFTQDSQHFAYVARQNGDFVEVRDNKPVRTVASGKHGATSVGWIAISLDGSHLAYETISGGQQFQAAHTKRALRSAVLDGRSGQEYNALGLSSFDFDPEARHYSYEVLGADGDRDLVNVDGHESRLYDSVANTHYLPDAKTIAFIARDASRFLRVTYSLGPSNSVSPLTTAINTSPE